MGACDAAKVLLYVRSILWDLGIPQEAASILYEDNDAATAIANANKPTPRTRCVTRCRHQYHDVPLLRSKLCC